MALYNYASNRTGLLLVDPYNDLLSDGGKLWPQTKAVAEAVNLLTHLRALVEAARHAGTVGFYVPHRRWREGDFDGWRHPGPWQTLTDRETIFGEGMWGGDWHSELAAQPGDVVIALGPERICQHRSRPPTEATQHREDHRGGNAGEYLC